MKIVWIGCHEEGLLAFRSVIESGRKIEAFITLDEEAFAKRSAGSRGYKELCNENKVPYYVVDTIKGNLAYRIIKEAAPDLLVVLGWSEILPEALLKLPTIGTVGTHAALLPHNRGSAPINWAIIHDEKITGNTMMWLSDEVDAGTIINQIEFPITMYDTCKTLYEKVAETNEHMLLNLLNNLENNERVGLNIKNETDEPILPRRRPKDGLINWNQQGRDLYNFVRALTKPYPGAFTFLNGQKWIIWEASLLPLDSLNNSLEPGQIGGNVYGFVEACNGIVVGTQSNLLLITELEHEGVCYSGQQLNEIGLKGRFDNE